MDIQYAIEALDHWGDQEDAAAITCHEADVSVHREREGAFRDAAKWLRELAEQPPRLRSMTTWQPIETAPKNAEVVVLRAFLSAGNPWVLHAYTTDPYCGWRNGEKWERWPHEFSPTHWMPLPTPPDADRGAGE